MAGGAFAPSAFFVARTTQSMNRIAFDWPALQLPRATGNHEVFLLLILTTTSQTSGTMARESFASEAVGVQVRSCAEGWRYAQSREESNPFGHLLVSDGLRRLHLVGG